MRGCPMDHMNVRTVVLYHTKDTYITKYILQIYITKYIQGRQKKW